MINVDGNLWYPKVITELNKSGELERRCRCRPVSYLNNTVSQSGPLCIRQPEPRQQVGFKDAVLGR